jgi:hypothetical protein
MKKYYRITRTSSGEVFYAEIPEGKKLTNVERQTEIWHENIEGGKYRGTGIEAAEVKDVPATDIIWLSFHETCLDDKKVSKKEPETAVEA